MTKEHIHKWKDKRKEKFVVFLAILFITVFFCGHLSAVIEQGAGMNNWSEMLWNHIKEFPFAFFLFNPYVIYFAICINSLIFFLLLSKRELPKAEMKGIEHGSNDFQTEEERNYFLANNTSPIYSLNLSEWEINLEKNKQQKKVKHHEDKEKID